MGVHVPGDSRAHNSSDCCGNRQDSIRTTSSASVAQVHSKLHIQLPSDGEVNLAYTGVISMGSMARKPRPLARRKPNLGTDLVNRRALVAHRIELTLISTDTTTWKRLKRTLSLSL